MPLVLCTEGELSFLTLIVSGLDALVYPFKNDRMPLRADTPAYYSEADFSGYTGAISLADWVAPYLSNARAFSSPSPALWTHNGGPIDNYIFGICCVDTANNLLWAERDPRAPVLMNPMQSTYSYQNVLTLAAEFTG